MTEFIECKTVEQFKLCCWLIENGIDAQYIRVDYAGDQDVVAVNESGVSLHARWVDGHAEIVQSDGDIQF